MRKHARQTLEIVFSEDPAELEEAGEQSPVKLKAIEKFLRDQIIVDVQEDREEPKGAVFSSSCLKMQTLEVFRP